MNLRIGVCHCQNEWIGRHLSHHILRHTVGSGQAEENISTDHSFCERALVGLPRVALLELVHAFFTALINEALAITHQHIFAFEPQAHNQICARHAGRSCARDHELNLFHFFPREL